MFWRKGRLVALGMLLAVTGCGFVEDLPAKPATYVEVLPMGSQSRRLPDSFFVGLSKDQDKAQLLGPNFGFRVDEVAKVEKVSADDARDLAVPKAFRAADGHELVMVKISGDNTLKGGRWKEKDGSPKAAVVVDGRRTELAAVPEPGSVIIASVRKGRPALLSVADRGRIQSLDLRTGTRAADALGPAPRDRVNADYEGTGRVGPGAFSRSLDIEINVETATLEPYFPGMGWARRGRAYLLLNLRQVSSDGLDITSSDPAVAFFVDPYKTFRLSMTGLGEARPFKGLAYNTVRLMARYLAVFEVPSAFRTGTLTIRPDGPLFAFRGTTSLGEYQNLRRVLDCGGRVACLTWQRRPPARQARVELATG